MVIDRNGKLYIPGVVITVLVAVIGIGAGYFYGEYKSTQAMMLGMTNAAKIEAVEARVDRLGSRVDELIETINKVIDQNTTLIAELRTARK